MAKELFHYSRTLGDPPLPAFVPQRFVEDIRTKTVLVRRFLPIA
jgi:hypothetical protein